MVDHIYINGRFYTSAKAKISIEDRGFLYGDGVFETLRSYKGKVFMLYMHLERLFHSLKVLKFNPGFDQRTVIDALYKTMAKSGLAKKDAYIKVMVTRGKHSGALHFSRDGKLWILVRHFYLEAPDVIRVGVCAQSPHGGGCRATFAYLEHEPVGVADIRSGE